MAQSQIEIGIEHLCVQDMPPDAFVALAAQLGCATVSLQAALNPRWNPFGFPSWSLAEDRALRRDVGARLADTGIALMLGEGLRIAAGKDVARFAPELDAFAELGARYVNLLGTGDGERARERDQTARFAAMAAERGLTVAIEFAPRGWIGSASDLLAMLDEIDGPPVVLLIDPMHFFRGGQEIASLANIPAARLAYLQLCDVPRLGSGPYFEEALYRRITPGDGELALESLVAALPDHVVMSLELPQVALAQTGVSHLERLRPAIARSREIVARARTGRPGGDPIHQFT